jgi:CheY-like chemotaxis protein
MNDQLLINKKILVADDDLVNHAVMKHMVKLLGGTAVYVADGLQAIQMLAAQSFDIIVMDIRMPVMDGVEAARYIRAELNSDIPIIATTAFSLESERQECLAAGINSYVSKPFTLLQMEAAITAALS